MEMLRDIHPTIRTMKTDMEEVKSQIKIMTSEQNAKIDQVNTDVSILHTELNDLATTNRKLETTNHELSERMNRLESYSRRSNLIFTNVGEDQAPIVNTVRNILAKMGIPNPNNITFDDIHRLGAAKATKGRSRPIIVRFLYRCDRQIVWESRRKLKGTNISMNEDFPEAYKADRGLLLPIVKAARKSGLKSSLVSNKVQIEGRYYGINDIGNLHSSCNPETACKKSGDNIMCFFGRYTPLSNFYSSKFRIGHTTYTSSEQFIQQKKAEHLGYDGIAQKVLATDEPIKQKAITRAIQADTKTWQTEARVQILPAIREKFLQNPELQTYLLETGEKILGEATRNDFWGIGLSLDHPQVLDHNQWKGKNVLGEILMSVRAEIKPLK